jgi:hypothetical protein
MLRPAPHIRYHIVIIMNRKAALNLLVHAATESIQQWARDIKGMRMGILIVIHTFGADMKWHPHIHLIVTSGGLSLDGKRWIATDPKFLMHHAGLKKRWKYQVTTRMKRAHREGQWRFPKSKNFLNCNKPLTFVGCFFGDWNQLQQLFVKAGKGATIAAALLRPG